MVWTHAVTNSGVASFREGGRHHSVHHYLFRLFIGPVPEGHVLLRTCGTKRCVAPHHHRLCPRKKSDEVRFWPRVEIGNLEECWTWRGTRLATGHGTFGILDARGRVRRITAARFALGLKLGRPVRADRYVVHICENNACVNPDHLLEVPPAEHFRTLREKGRYQPRRGADHPFSKATEGSVLHARDLARQGWKAARIAPLIGLSVRATRDLLHGKTWSHLPHERPAEKPGDPTDGTRAERGVSPVID